MSKTNEWVLQDTYKVSFGSSDWTETSRQQNLISSYWPPSDLFSARYNIHWIGNILSTEYRLLEYNAVLPAESRDVSEEHRLHLQGGINRARCRLLNSEDGEDMFL
jgi:hypothetical protein